MEGLGDSLPALRFLELGEEASYTNILEQLSSFSMVQYLLLNQFDLIHRGLQILSSMKQLKYLNLRKIEDCTQQDLIDLSQATQVTTLKIHHMKFAASLDCSCLSKLVMLQRIDIGAGVMKDVHFLQMFSTSRSRQRLLLLVNFPRLKRLVVRDINYATALFLLGHLPSQCHCHISLRKTCHEIHDPELDTDDDSDDDDIDRQPSHAQDQRVQQCLKTRAQMFQIPLMIDFIHRHAL